MQLHRCRANAVMVFLSTVDTAAAATDAVSGPGVAAHVPMKASAVLGILALCGVLGLIGQGARAIVGMKTLSDSAASSQLSFSDLFSLSRLLYSLVVGFVAGVLMALFYWSTKNDGLGSIDVDNFATMVRFAVAGYIGADIVEAFTTKFFDQAALSKVTDLNPLNRSVGAVQAMSGGPAPGH